MGVLRDLFFEQIKMKLAFILLIFALNGAKAGRRGIACLYKSANSYTSATLHSWGTSTRVGSCGRAHGRVPSRCGAGSPLTTSDADHICRKQVSSLKPQTEKAIAVYLTGKADCKDHNDPNSWMSLQQVPSLRNVSKLSTQS